MSDDITGGSAKLIRMAAFSRGIRFFAFIRNIAEAAVSRINPRDLVTHLMSSHGRVNCTTR